MKYIEVTAWGNNKKTLESLLRLLLILNLEMNIPQLNYQIAIQLM